MQIGQRNFLFLICTSNLAYKGLIIRTKEHEWEKKKENKTNPECLLTQASIIPYPLHAYIRIAKTTKIYTIETPYLSISEKLTRVYNQLIIQCNKKKRKEKKIKENYDS